MAVPVLEIHSHCSTFVSVVSSDFFKNQDFFFKNPSQDFGVFFPAYEELFAHSWGFSTISQAGQVAQAGSNELIKGCYKRSMR